MPLDGHVTSDNPSPSPKPTSLDWQRAGERDPTVFFPKAFLAVSSQHCVPIFRTWEWRLEMGQDLSEGAKTTGDSAEVKLCPFLCPDVTFRCGLIQGTLWLAGIL